MVKALGRSKIFGKKKYLNEVSSVLASERPQYFTKRSNLFHTELTLKWEKWFGLISFWAQSVRPEWINKS